MFTALPEPSTHLLMARAVQRERQQHVALDARAVRLVRLRRLDRRAEAAQSRARRARLAIG